MNKNEQNNERVGSGLRLRQIARVCALGMGGAVMLVPAVGADSARVGAYDFEYLTSGDDRARPVQVFDDGRNTYFQFRAGAPVPAIFSTRDSGPNLVVPAQEGPYVRVAEVHGHFLLQVGRSQAHVVHARGTRASAPEVRAVEPSGVSHPYTGGTPAGAQIVASLAPVRLNAPDTALDRNSYATPTKGDQVFWTERHGEEKEYDVPFVRGVSVLGPAGRRIVSSLDRAGSGAFFTVIGRDDDTYKEGLDEARAAAIRDALVKAGVPSDRITTKAGVMRKGGGSTNWDATVVVRTRSAEPTMRIAPAVPPGADPMVVQNVEALVRAGVLHRDAASVLLRRAGGAPTAAAPVPAPQELLVPRGGFTLAASDKTVQGAVRRWAIALKYQVVWDAPAQLDAPISGDGLIQAENLKDALDGLVRGLQAKGYVLEVTIYANRVVRFTSKAAAPEVPKVDPMPPGGARVVPQVATAVPQPQQWQMLPEDRTVAGTLVRWAGAAKWSVVWAAAEQVPVTGEAVFSQPDFKSAADYVMAQVTAAGYRLKVTTAGEQTLRVSSY